MRGLRCERRRSVDTELHVVARVLLADRVGEPLAAPVIGALDRAAITRQELRRTVDDLLNGLFFERTVHDDGDLKISIVCHCSYLLLWLTF